MSHVYIDSPVNATSAHHCYPPARVGGRERRLAEGWLAVGFARNRTYYTSFKTAKNGRRLKGLPEDLVSRNNSARPSLRAAISRGLDGGANTNKVVRLNRAAARELFANGFVAFFPRSEH